MGLWLGTNTEQNFALHADLCGDAREEVIIYDDVLHARLDAVTRSRLRINGRKLCGASHTS
jgi:hypothetical protein